MIKGLIKKAEQVYLVNVYDSIINNFEKAPKKYASVIDLNDDKRNNLLRLLDVLSKDKDFEIIPNENLEKVIIKYKKKNTKINKDKLDTEFANFMRRLKKLSKTDLVEFSDEMSFEYEIEKTFANLSGVIEEVILIDTIDELNNVQKIANKFQLVIYLSETLDDEEYKHRLNVIKDACKNYDIICNDEKLIRNINV